MVIVQIDYERPDMSKAEWEARYTPERALCRAFAAAGMLVGVCDVNRAGAQRLGQEPGPERAAFQAGAPAGWPELARSPAWPGGRPAR